MKQVNLSEAKATLSALLEQAAAGEDVIIAKSGKPRARLTTIAPATPRPIQWGIWDHFGWKLPDDFNDRDDELVGLFYGKGDRGAVG